MSDTPDVLDALARGLAPWPNEWDWRPGSSHAAELVFVPEEPPRASWWWRRSVPENGDTQ